MSSFRKFALPSAVSEAQTDLRYKVSLLAAVQNHGVPEDVTEELFRQSKVFFDQPEEVKLCSEVSMEHLQADSGSSANSTWVVFDHP